MQDTRKVYYVAIYLRLSKDDGDILFPRKRKKATVSKVSGIFSLPFCGSIQR